MWIAWYIMRHAQISSEREKQIKAWSRKKKDALINALNPDWNDLCRSIC